MYSSQKKYQELKGDKLTFYKQNFKKNVLLITLSVVFLQD